MTLPLTLVFPPSEPMANARLFVANGFSNGDNNLLVYHRGTFRRWSGSAWPQVPDDELESAVYLAFEHAVYTMARVPQPIPFRPDKNKVAGIVAALKAVTQVPQSVEMPAWLGGQGPIHPRDLMPMINGLLHVRDRRMLPPTPTFFCPYALPYQYDPTAPPPQHLLRFLNDLWPNDIESQNTLQEVMGLYLTPDTRHQKIVLVVGPRRSGKGTIGRVITGLLGRENVAGPTLASLGTNFGLQPLIDRPVAIVSDARLSGRADGAVVVERLLTISGEDTITIDRKYRGQWTGKLNTRLIILTNELPRFFDASGALASRFVVLKLSRTFLGKEDQMLTEKLLSELPGVLKWSLDGLDRLRQRGYFCQPISASGLISQMEDLGSPISAFLRDCCQLGPRLSVPVKDLYAAWKKWCEEQGQAAGSAQTLGRDLHTVIPDLITTMPRINGKQVRHYVGLAL